MKEVCRGESKVEKNRTAGCCPARISGSLKQYESIGKVKIVAGEVLFCVDERNEACRHSFPFGGGHVCSCEKRKEIALGKRM